MMVRNMSLGEILHETVQLVGEFMQCDSCLMYLMDRDDLVLCASNPPHPGNIGKVRLKINEGLTGWVAGQRRLLAISREAFNDPRFKYFSDLPEDTYHGFLSAPIIARDRVVGVINSARGKDDDGLVLVTRDAGKTWTEVPIKEPPLSVFFLNESTGWIVTPNGLWRTDESGLSWRKIKGLKGVERVHFLTEDHGFAVGSPKLMMETKDGGKTWTDIAAAKD